MLGFLQTSITHQDKGNPASLNRDHNKEGSYQ